MANFITKSTYAKGSSSSAGGKFFSTTPQPGSPALATPIPMQNKPMRTGGKMPQMKIKKYAEMNQLEKFAMINSFNNEFEKLSFGILPLIRGVSKTIKPLIGSAKKGATGLFEGQTFTKPLKTFKSTDAGNKIMTPVSSYNIRTAEGVEKKINVEQRRRQLHKYFQSKKPQSKLSRFGKSVVGGAAIGTGILGAGALYGAATLPPSQLMPKSEGSSYYQYNPY